MQARRLAKATAILVLVSVATGLAVLGGVPHSLTSLIAPMYDGWKVGGLEGCPEPDFDVTVGRPATWDCAASLAVWLAAAREGFDRRDPGHAPVVRTTLREYVGDARFLSNCCLVAVFDLADGSIRAIGVAHLGVDYSRVAVVPDGPDR
jgi:hypothetical protein